MTLPASRTPDDAHWMRRALRLARPLRAATWPNPTVGACVVRDGRLLGEGVHLGVGRPHAEVAALQAARRAGHEVRGSTVYVTLEPCNHFGRTPPCTIALLDAGVRRVVFAVADDNLRVEGGGAKRLREAGIEVRQGPLDGQAYELNHPFFETSRDDEVHWTLKLALGLDGTLAPAGVDLRDPECRRITGPLAHRRAHRLRAGARCVVVGAGTVAADRPRLDVRGLGPGAFSGEPPRPVVLDSRARFGVDELPPGALVLHDQRSTGRPSADGTEWQAVEAAAEGRLDWLSIERELVARGLGLALVEGGAKVAESLLRERPPHRVHLLVAPRSWESAALRLNLAGTLESSYRRVRVRPVGVDEERVYVRRGLPCGPGSAGE